MVWHRHIPGKYVVAPATAAAHRLLSFTGRLGRGREGSEREGAGYRMVTNEQWEVQEEP